MDKSPIRWLHFSDFHVGKDEYAQIKLFKEIISHVEGKKSNGVTPDLIFVTGDIANNGLENEYRTFLTEFLEPLIDLLGEDIKERVFIVPGNHDVNRKVFGDFDRNSICDLKSIFFDPNNGGFEKRKQVLPRFENYHKHIDIFPTSWLESEMGSFSKQLDLNGIKLGIVGVNTAWVSKDDEDRHRLSLGHNILEDSLTKVKDSDLKIVLGHHPLNWLDDKHEVPIRSILGKYSSLYLHGHLHENRVSPEDGAGHGFLCIQTGAGFQTREKEKWINGFLWGELDVKENVIRLQPRQWSFDNREWRLGSDLPEIKRQGDWWIYSLPTKETNVSDTDKKKTINPYPNGWQPLDTNFLDQRRETISTKNAVRFFDGGTPDWSIALSNKIPKLTIVNKALAEISGLKKLDKPKIILLIGPTGEGKSTALKQTVVNLLDNNVAYNILWRIENSREIELTDIMNLPLNGNPWLIVADAADNIAKEIYKICKILKNHRNDIHFLLASRDTDWKNAEAHKITWIDSAHFIPLGVSGLKIEGDAKKIIDSLFYFGIDAQGNLSHLSKDAATKELLKIATNDKKVKGSSLLGAFLKLRYGNDLKEHIKALMFSLEGRMIPGTGIDLLQAFSYIAALHAIDLNFLTKDVLAETLGCQIEHLNPFVLSPLGKEAAISEDGQIILTRHQQIAETVLELLPEVFEDDVEQKYIDLVNSVVRMWNHNVFVPLIQRWNVDLTNKFLEQGKNSLAHKLGEKLYEINKKNPFFILHLSRIYREGSNLLKARELIESNVEILRQRGVFIEWSIIYFGNKAFCIILLICSLDDKSSKSPINVKEARKTLNSLTIVLKGLYEEQLNFALKEGSFATARLSLILNIQNIEEDFDNEFDKYVKKNGLKSSKNINQDIIILRNAASYIWDLCANENEKVKFLVSNPDDFKLNNLLELLHNANQSRQLTLDNSQKNTLWGAIKFKWRSISKREEV